MTKILKAGVVGAGVFGGYHAGKYAAHSDVELVGIFDVDPVRSKLLADKMGCASFSEVSTFVKAIDVATIACPAAYHAAMATAILSTGKSVLIEKPIAVDASDGANLLSLAKEMGAVIAVGHQERLVFGAMGLFDIPERPLSIEAVRMGPQSDRGTDVSVTLDLLIHDADLVLTLMGEDAVNTVNAKGQRHYSDHFDHIQSDMIFAGGAHVKLTASRVHMDRERWMRIQYPSGNIEVNFITREFKNTTPFVLNENFADTEAGRDSLGANVNQFIAAVLDPEKSPAVSGEAGLRALKLALAIDAAAS